MLGEEDSLGQEAADNVKEELKFQLAVLYADMKELNKNWDFTLLINPLLENQGPAFALVPKLKNQIDRMTKLRDEFLQKKGRRNARQTNARQTCKKNGGQTCRINSNHPTPPSGLKGGNKAGRIPAYRPGKSAGRSTTNLTNAPRPPKGSV
jgi:hypothetical protein